MNNSSDRVWYYERTSQVSEGHNIAVSNCQKSDGGPINTVNEKPVFNVGEDGSAAKDIDEEYDGLGH
jgi:hypothetical protein